MSFLIQRIERGGGGTDLGRTTVARYVPGAELIVGRGGTVDLRLEGPELGLEHAVLRRAGEGWEVEDRGTAAGTYLNGKRVNRAPLAHRDWVEIGRYRLEIQIAGGGDTLGLLLEELVRPAGGRATAAEAPPEPPRIDYLAAHDIERPWFSRALLGALAVAAAGLAVGGLVVTGHEVAFRPGRVSDAHGSFADDCARCHEPFRGPQDARCERCHAGPEHQPRQVEAPPCSQCHTEHRFVPRLAAVADGDCRACHRDLQLADGGEPIFARRVTDFARDHPQFAVTLNSPSGILRRLRLDTPEGRTADRAAIRLDHALHLRPGLKSPTGPVQLDCTDCHLLGGRDGEILPVVFEDHCQRCHRLTAGAVRVEAPHGSPTAVHEFLLREFAEAAPAAAPLAEQRRRLTRRGGTPPAGFRLEAAVFDRVVEAEYDLIRSACAKCHTIDFGAYPPRVAAPGIPGRWYEYARFTHFKHRIEACTSCHDRAPGSRQTADVLLPGIATCRRCHGTDGGTPRPASATTRCVACHIYHDQLRRGSWEVATGRSAPAGELPEAPGGTPPKGTAQALPTGTEEDR